MEGEFRDRDVSKLKIGIWRDASGTHVRLHEEEMQASLRGWPAGGGTCLFPARRILNMGMACSHGSSCSPALCLLSFNPVPLPASL